MEELKYLGTILTNQNYIQEEIKKRLKSWNACYHSVQNIFLSSSLLSKILNIYIHKNIILSVVYGCETWSLTLKEERRFNNLYSSPNIVRVTKSIMRWAGYVACMGERRGVYSVLVRRPNRKRPLGRPRRRWECNIKMDLQAVGWVRMDWIELTQDRDRWRALVNAVMKLRVP
jgi:hypothetical protein